MINVIKHHLIIKLTNQINKDYKAIGQYNILIKNKIKKIKFKLN